MRYNVLENTIHHSNPYNVDRPVNMSLVIATERAHNADTEKYVIRFFYDIAEDSMCWKWNDKSERDACYKIIKKMIRKVS